MTATAPTTRAVTPYGNDSNTVLLEHFDNSLAGSAYTVYSTSDPCGSPYPSVTNVLSYADGQEGLNQALLMYHPSGMTEPALNYFTFPGTDLLCQTNGTLEFWVNLASYGTNGLGLVSQGPYFGACVGWTFSMGISSNGILQASAWNAFDLNSGSVTVPLNRWVHLAVTWGAAGGKLYIDGILVGTHASTGYPAPGYGGKILASFGTTDPTAYVLIDELRISRIQRTTFNSTPAPSRMGSWISTSSIPYPRYDAAAGIIGKQLYVVEGDGGSPPATQYLLPLTYQWIPRNPVSHPRLYGAAASIGNTLYVAGGLYFGVTTNLLVGYDLNTSQAIVRKAMPTARLRAAAAALGNRLYVFGGLSNGVALSTVEIYDPSTDRWTTGTPMPTPRSGASAAVIDGKIHVVGGYSGAYTGAFETYDPATDSWTSNAPLPLARSQAAIGVINGRLHVAGGVKDTIATVHDVFDPAQGAWAGRAARRQHQAHMPNGQVGIGGVLCLPGTAEDPRTELYLPPLTGPVYPPPLGASYSTSGPSDQAGRSGGLTWYFNPVPLRSSTFVYWGVTNYAVRLSFNNSQFANLGEVMQYQPSLSYLPTGLVVWAGQTTIPGFSTPIYTRCSLTITTGGGAPNLMSATNLDLPPNLGGLLALWPSAAYQANIRFEASYSTNGPFSPALNVYDAAFKPYGGGTAYSSLTAGFYYVNQPPTISAITNRATLVNTPTAPIPFTIGDLESGASALGVSVRSGDTNLLPLSGLVLGGSGSNRTVTVTPASNTVGETTITLTVTNGTEAADTTFFLLVNSPPQLAANTPLSVDAGGTAVISNALLAATDAESGPSDLTYRVNPDGNGGPPHEGLLQLNGTNLASGSTFTQADIDAGRLSYVSTNRCATRDDFQFNVTDAHGGVTPTGEFTAYSFRIEIQPVHLPFDAVNAEVSVGLGGAVTGQLAVANSNCPPVTHVFRLVDPPLKGTATVNSNGQFIYTATIGETGDDQFQFQAFDGVSDAQSPGTVIVHIARLPPEPINGSNVVIEGSSCQGQLSATQLNNPPFATTYLLASQGTNGTAVITDPATGAFTYTPLADTFGFDSFTFLATDGVVTSTVPGIVSIVIRPALNPNDIVVADSAARSVILVRPSTGKQFALSTNDLFRNPQAVAIETTGSLIVLDSGGGLLRVDPTNGAQTLLVASNQFSNAPIGPTGVALQPDGGILVADGVNGLVRIDPVTGSVTNFASGGALALCQGVTVGLDGSVYAAVPGALAGGSSAIVKVDPVTRLTSVVASGDPLLLPLGQALGNDGLLYLTDVSSFAGAPPDKLLAVAATGGSPVVLSTNALLSVPTGLGRSTNDTLFVACNGSATILESTTNGALSVVSSGGLLQQPFGLAVVRGTPRLTGIEVLPNGSVRLHIRGEAGYWVNVEISSDLFAWPLWSTIPNPTGTIQLDDGDGQPIRFYRLRRY